MVCHATKYSTDKIDVGEINQVEKIINEINPDYIINCAAITQVDEIEKNPSPAYRVNADGAKNVATIAERKKIKNVYISTDSVFDGERGFYTENDKPNPINEYGKSKKLGEDLIKEISTNYVIIRTNFYGYSSEKKFLFNWILTNLKNNNSFPGFTDVIFNGLEVSDLSKMILELLHIDYSGILNIASDEIWSKHQFAVEIARNLGFNSDNIIKTTIKETKGLVAKRPLNTTLNHKLSEKLLSHKPRSLKEWLKTIPLE